MTSRIAAWTAAALIAMTPAVATAAPSPTPSPTGPTGESGARWLALGDSISSGFGIADVPATPSAWGESCYRATGQGDASEADPAWPVVAAGIVAGGDAAGRQTFTACSGAITDHWLRQVAEAYRLDGADLSGITDRATSVEDAETRLRPVIRALAEEGRRWDVISLTFGANNVGLGGAVETCLDTNRSGEPMTWGSDSWGGCEAAIAEVKARNRTLVGDGTRPMAQGTTPLWRATDPDGTVLGEVSRFVRPGGVLLVLGYPQLYAAPETSVLAPLLEKPDLARAVNCEGLTPERVRLVRDAVADLNAGIEAAAEQADRAYGDRLRVVYVDPTSAFDAPTPHGLCAATPWINSPFSPGPLHPDGDGHRALGEQVAAVVTTRR